MMSKGKPTLTSQRYLTVLNLYYQKDENKMRNITQYQSGSPVDASPSDVTLRTSTQVSPECGVHGLGYSTPEIGGSVMHMATWIQRNEMLVMILILQYKYINYQCVSSMLKLRY